MGQWLSQETEDRLTAAESRIATHFVNQSCSVDLRRYPAPWPNFVQNTSSESFTSMEGK